MIGWSNTSKCPRCSRTLISEELRSHVCNTPNDEIVVIPVEYATTIDNKNGGRTTIGKGLDGKIYYLEEPNYLKGRTRRKLTETKFGDSDEDLPPPGYWFWILFEA